ACFFLPSRARVLLFGGVSELDNVFPPTKPVLPILAKGPPLDIVSRTPASRALVCALLAALSCVEGVRKGLRTRKLLWCGKRPGERIRTQRRFLPRSFPRARL